MTSSPFIGQTRSGDAADQRVRRTGRQTEPPGDQIPDDRADQTGQHHLDIDRIGAVDLDDLGDRIGHSRGEHEHGDEIEEGRPETATRGLSTRVETTVAMELAAS